MKRRLNFHQFLHGNPVSYHPNMLNSIRRLIVKDVVAEKRWLLLQWEMRKKLDVK